MRKNTVYRSLLAAGLLGLTTYLPAAQAATLEDLEKRLAQQAAEMQQLKAELATLKGEQAKQAAQVEQVQQTQDTKVAQSATGEGGTQGGESGNTTLSSYGEIGYSRPTRAARDAQIDVGRAVLGITHRFDPKTKLVGEFEWEHAVTSADDRGEAAVEQLYVEREFNTGLRAKAGLFLIPAGLLNTNHEPTAYYGVQRNFVETAIIPTTWREAGISLSGNTANSLSWDVGLTTGFDLNKWDAASGNGRESPLGSVHQEGQLARARNMAVYGALNWRGVPGLLVGGSVFTGEASHRQPDFPAQNARITLADLHSRYQVGKWDLSALYAKGFISNTDAYNTTVIGQPTPIPASFYGAYLQAAYRVLETADYSLSPFVRYERFNTAKSYSGSALAGGVQVGPDQKVWTVGANFLIGEGVVLKADYQKFREDKSLDRLNLGVGYNF